MRGYGEAGDPLALKIFDQQAMAIGRLFTIAANFTDPHVYLLGGGVVEAARHFRGWFLDRVRAHTVLRAEQAARARDRPGARPGYGRGQGFGDRGQGGRVAGT